MHETVTRPGSLRRETEAATAERGLLRFLTCGSVDDGKSTLIGRLLYDCKLLYEDQLAALAKDTSRFGTTGENVRHGAAGRRPCRPSASRASPSTSPIASSPPASASSSSPTRRAMSNTPATWRPAPRPPISPCCWSMRARALLTQTRRHSYIVSLLGIRHVVLAVNKMDAVKWDRATFEKIAAEYNAFAEKIGLHDVTAHPALGADRRQCHRRAASRCRGIPARRCSSISKPSRCIRTAPTSRSACRCNGSTGRTRISAAFPAPSRQAWCGPATRSCRCRPAAPARSSSIVTFDGEMKEAVAGRCRHGDAGRRDRRQPRRRAGRRYRSALPLPSNSPPTSSGWRKSRCCRAAAISSPMPAT